jgi:hypothetical protein
MPKPPLAAFARGRVLAVSVSKLLFGAPLARGVNNEFLTRRRYRPAIAGFVTHTASLICNNSRRLHGGNFVEAIIYRRSINPR